MEDVKLTGFSDAPTNERSAGWAPERAEPVRTTGTQGAEVPVVTAAGFGDGGVSQTEMKPFYRL